MTEGEGTPATTEPAASDAQEQTLDDVEQTVTEAEEKGYFGETPEYDRDAYTLKTGPESPSAIEATLAARRSEIDDQLDELHDRAQQRGGQARERAEQARANQPERHEQTHERVDEARESAHERAGQARESAAERRATRQAKRPEGE